MYKNRKIHILIIEDHITNIQYLRAILQKLGYENIYTTSNAKEAIEFSKKNHIDIIFMDINIEGSIDGIMCAHMINKNKAIPIIYMTSYEESDTINDAMDTNIYGYLIKPFKYKDVEITLKIAIKRAFQIAQNQRTRSSKIDLSNDYYYVKKNKTLQYRTEIVKLTKKESLIIDLLVKNLNEAVSHSTIKEHVWEDKEIANSTLRDTILRVRRKTPLLKLENVPSVGYVLKSEM